MAYPLIGMSFRKLSRFESQALARFTGDLCLETPAKWQLSLSMADRWQTQLLQQSRDFWPCLLPGRIAGRMQLLVRVFSADQVVQIHTYGHLGAGYLLVD